MFSFFKSKPVTTIATSATLSGAMFMIESQNIGRDYTQQFEGTVLEVYRDSVGVETWCTGETMAGRLPEGEKYTKEYCDQLFSASYSGYSARMYACYDNDMKKYVTPTMHATFTDVYYNTGKSCNTGMMRALRNKDPVGACEFILRYKYAGGKDCSVRANNCYGVWDRRVTMYDLCVEDAKKIQ